MKRLLLLFTTILLISCSSDDSDENEESTQTFLEKYDGVGFSSYERYYVFFFNDEVFLKKVETDVLVDGDHWCTEIREGVNTIYGETENVVILTNDLERLVVKFISNYLDEEYTETVEYTVNPTQNAMTEESESGFISNTYFKTTKTYSSFCD